MIFNYEVYIAYLNQVNVRASKTERHASWKDLVSINKVDTCAVNDSCLRCKKLNQNSVRVKLISLSPFRICLEEKRVLGRRQQPVAGPCAKHPLPEVNELSLARHDGLKEKIRVLPKKLRRVLVERVHSAAPPTLLLLSDHVLAPRTVTSQTMMLKSLTIHLLQGLIFLPYC